MAMDYFRAVWTPFFRQRPGAFYFRAILQADLRSPYNKALVLFRPQLDLTSHTQEPL